MNYWIGIIGSKSTLDRFKDEGNYWFCLPKSCEIDDFVVMYVSQKISTLNCGVIGTFKISSKNECKDNECRSYGLMSGTGERPIYVELTLDQWFNLPIPFKSLKASPKLINAQFIRRNMQATYFKISKTEFNEIKVISNKSACI